MGSQDLQKLVRTHHRNMAEKCKEAIEDWKRLIGVFEKQLESSTQLFEKYGEGAFRAEERAAVAECAAKTGAVIATGGGAPMFEQNRYALKSNGFVVLLRRSIDKLETSGRPLSRDAKTLAAMSRERMPVYTAFADAEADNDGDAEICARKIKELFYENFRDQRA